MVVDDIEEYRDTAHMAFIDKRLQSLRAAIARAGREPLDAVISPIAAPRTFGDRHQFDRGNAELNEMIEMRDSAGKVTTLRKGSEMQLIDHQFVPRPALPSGIAPFVSSRVDDLAGAMHAVGLIARRQIGIRRAIDRIAVAVARAGLPGRQRKPAVRLRD